MDNQFHPVSNCDVHSKEGPLNLANSSNIAAEPFIKHELNRCREIDRKEIYPE